MKKSLPKRIIDVTGFFLVIFVLIVVAAFVTLQIRTNAMLNDYSDIFKNGKYSTPVYIEGVDVIAQDVSCGYAVIEMFSSWNGNDITEESLYDKYGKVITSTGNSFCDEMNKQFPEYTTTIHKYMKNTELVDLVYDSLSNGVPVPFEWAALHEDEWTLHYSLVIGADIHGNKIMVANPYGYYEELTVEEFLNRTSYEAYDKMPLFLKFGFAFGFFEKNTIFIVR